MGLDMFLNKVRKEEVAYWRKANAINKWFSDQFADGELENCKPYEVDFDSLRKLKETCEKVLNSSELVYKEVPVSAYDYDKGGYVEKKVITKVLEDSSVAEELLPTESGFFYGSTLYDESYVEDLEETVRQIDKILAEVDPDEWRLEYYAWW